MSARSEPTLPFDEAEIISPCSVRLQPDDEVRLKADTTSDTVRLKADTTFDLADEPARRAAVDPTQNVVLEASAGTGKTRVLVERYVNLLRAGVEPDHILAITFTRKEIGRAHV